MAPRRGKKKKKTGFTHTADSLGRKQQRPCSAVGSQLILGGEEGQSLKQEMGSVSPLPSEATSAKFSSITLWYRCLCASSKSSHSSWEKYIATSSKVPQPCHDEDSQVNQTKRQQENKQTGEPIQPSRPRPMNPQPSTLRWWAVCDLQTNPFAHS